MIPATENLAFTPGVLVSHDSEMALVHAGICHLRAA